MIIVVMGVSGSGKTTVGRLLAKRLEKSDMLDSQMASLEEPEDAIEADIRNSPEAIVAHIESQLGRRQISR